MKTIFKVSTAILTLIFLDGCSSQPIHEEVMTFPTSQDCKIAWQQTQYFINKKSNLKTQIATDTLIQAYSDVNRYSTPTMILMNGNTDQDVGMLWDVKLGTKNIRAAKLDNKEGGCTISLQAAKKGLGGLKADEEVLSEWKAFMYK